MAGAQPRHPVPERGTGLPTTKKQSGTEFSHPLHTGLLRRPTHDSWCRAHIVRTEFLLASTLEGPGRSQKLIHRMSACIADWDFHMYGWKSPWLPYRLAGKDENPAQAYRQGITWSALLGGVLPVDKARCRTKRRILAHIFSPPLLSPDVANSSVTVAAKVQKRLADLRHASKKLVLPQLQSPCSPPRT